MRVARPLILLLSAALSLWAALELRETPLTGRAQDYAREIAASAAASYVTLRTLNAFLSTAQEVQVEGSVVVASGAVQPLKVLEPIDDTVERIAGVVFAVMVVSGVLAVSLGPLGGVGFTMLALAFGLWACAAASGRRMALGGFPRMLAAYGGFLALAIPLTFLLSALIADRMTDATWTENNRIIGEITASVEDAPLDEQDGLRDSLRSIDRYQRLAVNIRDRADELIGSFVAILAVFLFKVLVLPLMLLGGFAVAARAIAHAPGGEKPIRG